MITQEKIKPKRLSELISDIRTTLSDNLEPEYLVIGTLSDFSGPHFQSGNFYFKLIEKKDNEKIAEIKTIIWRSQEYIIDNYSSETNTTFQDGLELLVKVKVNYHHIYGLSLIIREIDASYTLGKVEDAKRVTLKKLEEEKIIKKIDGKFYSANKRLKLPLVIQKIAIITSKGIEGENDFISKLNKNKRGYLFSFPYRELLYTSMQGKASIEGIIEKLNFLKNKSNEIDIIAIVRGGGDSSNFDAFNDYELCKTVANFQVPIITGIGHEINQNIIDLVANTSAMVPAEAAETIIEHNREFEFKIDEIGRNIALFSRDKIKAEEKSILEQENNLRRNSKTFLSNEKKSINYHRDTIKNLNPENVLARGYAILWAKGKIVLNTKGLKEKEKLKAILKSNIIESEITKIEKRNEKQFNI